MKHILVFTDGAAKGNPGPGGYGAVVQFPDGKVREVGGYKAHTTNNEMELQAVVEALALIRKSPMHPIAIYIDSKYVAEGAQKWIFGWQKNGWKTKAGEPVRNKELWQSLVPLLTGLDITWHRIPGHSGIPGNERADHIASSFATKTPVSLFEGIVAQYAVDLTNTSFDAVKRDARSTARARQNQKAYTYVSLCDGVVRTHATWAECEARVKGKSKTRFKKALSAEEERAIVQAFRTGRSV